MANIYRIGSIIAILAAMILLISCDDRQEGDTTIIVPPQEGAPTYTIMYLAVGGDTLDAAIEYSISNITKSALASNINLTACIKWTKGYTSDMSSGKGEVCRLVIDRDSKEIEIDEVGDNSYPLYDPQNIATFIEWSKEVAPADNYILLLAGHGNGWHPEVGIESTRGTLRDTDLNRYVSLEELSEGIALSNTHFRMIQMISCLMNTMEYITPLSGHADYIMGSSHVALMLCSELHWLHMSLRSIKSDEEEVFVDALEEYMGYIKMEIGLLRVDDDSLDYSITESKQIDALNTAIESFTDTLVALYEEEASYGKDLFAERYGATMDDVESAISKAYYFIGSHLDIVGWQSTEYIRMAFTYDIVDIAKRAAAAIASDALIRAAEEVERCSRKARIINYTTQLDDISEVFYGVTLTNSEMWEARDYEEAGYEDTLFDRATGWSRFLRRNNVTLRY